MKTTYYFHLMVYMLLSHTITEAQVIHYRSEPEEPEKTFTVRNLIVPSNNFKQNIMGYTDAQINHFAPALTSEFCTTLPPAFAETYRNRTPILLSDNIDADLKNSKQHILVSSLGLGISYVTTIIFDQVYYPDDEYSAYLFIPVLGPFIYLGVTDSWYTGSLEKGLLILSGVAQTAFATYFVISLTKYSKLKKNATMSVSPSLNAFSVKIQF